MIQKCYKLILILLLQRIPTSVTQTYEVAEIDCAVGHGGKELLTARLRKPDGFRGIPIFADDRGTASLSSTSKQPSQDLAMPLVFQQLNPDSPCQIYPDPLDSSGRVYVLKVMDFTKCGVLKRDGFINVRVWFPQLPGVVMLSDQEVIIMCKPPQPTVLQSKAAGFAGSIPKGPRVTGVVEEHPGQLEYEVALFRETTSSGGRSVVAGGGGGAYLTGTDAQELPVDQAVPIGTRLQLRAKISSTSAWQHAKLLDVSVSPDPKNPIADGAVALVKNGCRNPDLASIIPKQPYRYKDRTNEVVLDFEAFLLSNMGDRSTLWLHTQIKACMEPLDCESEVCIMDIYQPASYGRRRRRHTNPLTTSNIRTTKKNQTTAEYSSPLLKHWKTIVGPTETENIIETSRRGPSPSSIEDQIENGKWKHRNQNRLNTNGTNTQFEDNIGFSVIMPPDYYRSSTNAGPNKISATSGLTECRGWILSSMISLLGAIIAGSLACLINFKLAKAKSIQDKLCYEHSISPTPSYASSSSTNKMLGSKLGGLDTGRSNGSNNRNVLSSKYARDPSLYRS